jgi:hypothetical protein
MGGLLMSDHIPDGSKMDTPRTDSWHCLSVGGLKVVPASFARQLERELADMTAFRDSEMRWANQYKQERDEARECMREIISQLTLVDARASGETWQLATCDGDEVERWRKAAGLTNRQTNENAPIVNREEER